VKADRVLYNGRFYTMNPARPRVSAIAIAGERILAVGDDEAMRDLLHPGGEAVNLEGRTVVPGFVDAHVHFLQTALLQDSLALEALPSPQAILTAVAGRLRRTEPGQWLVGFGWDEHRWPGWRPSRTQLDSVSPHHPVVLLRHDGHTAWANSQALRRAGITAQTPDPPGGLIHRLPNGEPSGLVSEAAVDLLMQAIPPPPPEQRRSLLRRVMARANAAGLTGIHEIPFRNDVPVIGQDYQALAEAGQLTLRVTLMLHSEQFEEAVASGPRTGEPVVVGEPALATWLRWGPVKWFTDGALGSGTAAMLEPYAGQGEDRGLLRLSSEEIAEILRRANAAGLACAFHAIGDAANRHVVEALEQVRREGGKTGALRHRIEHGQHIHPDDVVRMGRLGVIVVAQPTHLADDMVLCESKLGERARWAYPFAALLRAGAHLAFSSDSPIADFSPLTAIYHAVTRRRLDGHPGPEGFEPAQRLTVAQAVAAYTTGAAYASGEEAIKGSLTPGRLADLVVLSQDLFALPPIELLNTAVVATMVGGRFVHRGF